MRLRICPKAISCRSLSFKWGLFSRKAAVLIRKHSSFCPLRPTQPAHTFCSCRKYAKSTPGLYKQPARSCGRIAPVPERYNGFHALHVPLFPMARCHTIGLALSKLREWRLRRAACVPLARLIPERQKDKATLWGTWCNFERTCNERHPYLPLWDRGSAANSTDRHHFIGAPGYFLVTFCTSKK